MLATPTPSASGTPKPVHDVLATQSTKVDADATPTAATVITPSPVGFLFSAIALVVLAVGGLLLMRGRAAASARGHGRRAAR